MTGSDIGDGARAQAIPSDPEAAFHFGIIGGCLARQTGMPDCQLYTHLLAERLRETTGVSLQTRVARYAEGEYERRFQEIAAGNRLDGVLLHVRTLVIRKAGVVVKHRSAGSMTYALHPALARRGEWQWDDLESAGFDGLPHFHRPLPVQAGTKPEGTGPDEEQKDSLERPPAAWQAPWLSFGRVSRFAGSLVGLERWTLDDEAAAVARVYQACQEQGIRLLVMGPLPAPRLAWVEAFNERVRQRLRQETARLGVAYCQYTPPDAAARMADGTHLDETGHRMVADLLAPILEGWVRGRR